MLEVLNVGSIDIGSIGDILFIFVQVVGVDLVYIGVELFKFKVEVILVVQGSLIYNVVELKGKKVVFQKGFSFYNLLLCVLQFVGLKFSDIQLVYFVFVDVCVVFQQGNVDVWVIWDLYYFVVLLQGGVWVFIDGIDLKQMGFFYFVFWFYVECNGVFIEGVFDIFIQVDVLIYS